MKIFWDHRLRCVLEIGVRQFILFTPVWNERALISKEDFERYRNDGIKVGDAKEKWRGTKASDRALSPEMFAIEICGERHEIASIYQGTDLKYHILMAQNAIPFVFEKYEEAKSYIEKELEIR